MFLKYISFNNLIEENDKILISFSGGADSVFMSEKLLEIKEKFNISLHLVYVNHNIREDISNDIKVLKDFAKKYNLDFTIIEINKERKKLSEDKLRNLRYEAIEKLLKELKFNKIATGHNKNDNAETIIFRILRGTSIEGLKGISVKRDHIIRPILCYEKEYILENVKNEYSNDETNFENIYSRNMIRNMAFPIFEKINSKFKDNIIKLYSNLQEDEVKKNIITMLKKYNIKLNSKKINEIYKIYISNESKIIDLDKEYVWYKSYDNFKIIKKEELVKQEKKIILKYKNIVEFNGYIISFDEALNLEKYSKKIYNIYNHSNLNENSEILIRTRENGDRIKNKKLKKFFIDNKIDKLERDKMPVLELNSTIIMVGDKFSLENKEKQNKLCICIRRKDGK